MKTNNVKRNTIVKLKKKMRECWNYSLDIVCNILIIKNNTIMEILFNKTKVLIRYYKEWDY